MTLDQKSSVHHADDYAHCEPLFAELRSLDHDQPRWEALRTRLVTDLLPLAEHIAARFAGRGESRDDLVQVARLGLVNAVDRYDPEVGRGFLSFAVPTIMGEVRRHFRDTGWAVRMPRRLQELHLMLSRGSADLAQTLGRAPTPSELADHLGLDADDVREGLMAGNAYRAASVDKPVGDTEGTLVDTIGEDDHEYAIVENHTVLRPLLQELPERERTILAMRFFGRLTQTQIADEMGISQMHVSRLLAQTLGALRDQLSEEDGEPHPF